MQTALPQFIYIIYINDLAAGAAEATTTAAEGRPLVVIGHRGKGMNTLVSPDPRLRGDVRENTLRAFNDAAASHPAVAYVEFDVQVKSLFLAYISRTLTIMPPPAGKGIHSLDHRRAGRVRHLDLFVASSAAAFVSDGTARHCPSSVLASCIQKHHGDGGILSSPVSVPF
jgi:hypothetical protein